MEKMISNNCMTQDGAIECRILQQRLHFKGKLWESVARADSATRMSLCSSSNLALASHERHFPIVMIYIKYKLGKDEMLPV